MDSKFNIDEIFAKTLGDHSMEPSANVWDKIQGQLDASASSHNVDKVFEKGLSEHTMEPPSYVWDNIKNTLELAAGRRRRIIGWIAGTASAVILSFVGGYFIANSGSSAENVVSEKISGNHQVQIDVNAFWNLRKVVMHGETTSGGQTYTNMAPTDNNNGSTSHTVHINHNNHNNGMNENNANHDGYFGTHSRNDLNRKTPNNTDNNYQNPVVSAQQGNGGEENGKKNNAVTSDEKGTTETLKGTKGSTNVTADDNNTEVVIGNSNTETDQTINTDKVNTETDLNHTDEISTVEKYQDEKGNPLMVKDEVITSFTILPYFSPTYTWRNSSMLSQNGIQNVFDTTGGNQKFNEKVNFSFSTGLLVGYNFTPRLTVFIGASFNSFSNTTYRNDLHSKAFDQMAPGDSSTYALTSAGELGGVNVIPTQGTAENPTYIEQDYMIGSKQIGSIQSITQTFSYVEVPVLVRYRLLGPKVGLIFTGGLSTGFIVQNDVTLNSDTESRNSGSTSQIRNFNMNAILGVGLEVRILPYMYLNVEPTFKYSFLNWSMDSRFQMNPISLGLNTGLAFKF